MSKQQNEPPAWLDVNEAAALSGKSVSTIRRLVSSMPEPEAAENIRREPLKDKGGDKILISRAYLVERFELPQSEQEAGPEPPQEEPRAAGGLSDLIEILERQIDAKDKQIAALQREGESKSRQLEQEQQTLADMAESLRQAVAVNTALNSKLLALTEKAGEHPGSARTDPQPGRESVVNSPWYFVALAVLFSLIAGLVLYLVIG